MKRAVLCALSCAACFCAAAWAQQFKFNLDQVAAKASDVVDLSLNGPTLQFAAKFLDTKDPDEAKVKQLLSGIEGIYIKNFEFNKTGGYTPADVESVRTQLRAPEWSRIIGIKSSEDNENAELFVRTVDKKVTGVAMVCAGPKELTVVNIVGPVDLDALAELGGHFGLPKLHSGSKKEAK